MCQNLSCFTASASSATAYPALPCPMCLSLPPRTGKVDFLQKHLERLLWPVSCPWQAFKIPILHCTCSPSWSVKLPSRPACTRETQSEEFTLHLPPPTLIIPILHQPGIMADRSVCSVPPTNRV
jgi:hypothetical protein